MKLRRQARIGIKFDGEKAAVFEQFNPGDGGAELDMEMAPVPTFGKRGGHAPGAVAQKTDARHTGKKSRRSENQARMKMPDDGMLHLSKAASNGFVAPKKWQCGGVMAKENHPLARLQCGEDPADFFKVLLAELPPFIALTGRSVRFINRQGNER